MTYSVTPNDWNGETSGLSLVDIYRSGESRGLYRARPKIEVPQVVSTISSHRIKSETELTIRSDACKWKIDGGWIPGKYRITVRVEHLIVDDGRCQLSALSAPVEFEVK